MAGSSGVANECLAGGPQTGVKPRSRTALRSIIPGRSHLQISLFFKAIGHADEN
jgi:hypothetical protein